MKLEELMQDEEFTAKLEKAKDLDEVLAMLKEQGIELSKENLETAVRQLDESELDESSLEAVAGGSVFSSVIAGARALAKWLKQHPGILPTPSPIRPRR